MDLLAINLSMALLTAYTFVVMINLVFKGEADSLLKYVMTVLFAGGAVLWFGMAASEIIHIIKDLS